jgi:superfamily II DNA or RNA helicase
MPAQVLRPYQQNGISEILAAYRGGARSVLAVAPTGSGKTTVFSSVLTELAARGQRGAVLVHRRELAAQACTRLREFGVRYGLIMAGEQPNPSGLVQVASVDTLAGRIRENTTLQRWAASVRFLVCDEAHLSTAPKWRRVLDYFTNALVLGVTATPWRLSGKPLAGAYGSCVVIATPRELREQGHLCGYQGFGYLAPDLSEVHTTAGEYNERESAAAMSESAIVDSVVEEWGQHARELSTVVFAVTVEHSRQLAARFKAAGVRAEHLDGQTPGEERKRILQRVADGRTPVLCNVGVAVEGLDIPRLKCCVLARPTKSLARAIQMMGRVRRPWEGVTARIHDHAFVIGAHGLPDDERDYTLTAKPDKPPSLSTCKACRALYSGTRCTAEGCGAVRETDSSERVLQLVSAEGFERREFDSTAPVVPPPAPAVRNPAPVKIEWGAVKPGRKLAGEYLGASTEDWQYGRRQRYHLRGGDRDYSLAGVAWLDKAMAHVPVGSPVTVKYLGREGDHEKAPHLFAVEFDDGVISG